MVQKKKSNRIIWENEKKLEVIVKAERGYGGKNQLKRWMDEVKKRTDQKKSINSNKILYPFGLLVCDYILTSPLSRELSR